MYLVFDNSEDFLMSGLKKIVRQTGACVLLLLLAGCASMMMTPEERVAKRAAEHQQARLEYDFEKAYSFTSPGYRQTTPYKLYLAGMGPSIKRTGFEIKQVVCSEIVCDVTVSLSYKYVGLAASKMGKDFETSRNLEEKWINSDGEWWLVPQN